MRRNVCAVNHYDPDQAPNAEQWLALDEQERIRLAEEHHRSASIKLPSLKVHAVFHAIVENQLAETSSPPFARWLASRQKV
jgi:hypothetical protein